MEKVAYIVTFLFVMLGESHVTSTPVPSNGEDKSQAAAANFRKFAYNLLDINYMEKFGDSVGAAAFSPFGVGYMLANLNTKVWNISTVGFEKLFELPSEKISDEYATLLEKLKEGRFAIKNVLYLCTKNCSRKLPPEATRQLKTKLIYTDYVSHWKKSWHLMNGMLAKQTNGKLDDQLIAKGGWYGGSVYPFTSGVYINTDYLKAPWHKRWSSVGHKNFADGSSLPYYQVEGKYSTLENEKYSVVVIPIKNSNKDMSAIFMLPKGNIAQLTKEDLAPFFKNAPTKTGKWKKTDKRVQVPTFKLILLGQHYMDLEERGINSTFCTSKHETIDSAQYSKKNEKTVTKPAYAALPIAKVTYIEISPKSVEVASAAGMTVMDLNKIPKLQNEMNEAGSKDSVDSSSTTAVVNSDQTISGGDVGSVNSPNIGGGGKEKKGTILFNKPFIWLIYDSQLGTLYYGSLISPKKYNKEREPEKGFEWMKDALKAFMWNCR